MTTLVPRRVLTVHIGLRLTVRRARNVGILQLGAAIGPLVAGLWVGQSVIGWTLVGLFVPIAWLGAMNLLVAYDRSRFYPLRRHMWMHRINCLVLALQLMVWGGWGLDLLGLV